jgi:hypothetical protein
MRKFFAAFAALIAVAAFITPSADARPMPNCIPGIAC